MFINGHNNVYIINLTKLSRKNNFSLIQKHRNSHTMLLIGIGTGISLPYVLPDIHLTYQVRGCWELDEPQEWAIILLDTYSQGCVPEPTPDVLPPLLQKKNAVASITATVRERLSTSLTEL